MEEVGKGCSEFCVEVGTATGTASILIRSRLKALACYCASHLVDFWLYAGLIGSVNCQCLTAP